MTTTVFKKMNLPLPPEMHEALFAESREMGVPTTRLVRRVLKDWLEERGRTRRREEIRRFAEAYAGTEIDLDSDLETAATEELRRFYATAKLLRDLPSDHDPGSIEDRGADR